MPASLAVDNTPSPQINKPSALYQVCAWDVGEMEPKLINNRCFSKSYAHDIAKRALLYDTAQYTGVKDLSKEWPYWDKVYTVKEGIVVESDVE